MLASHHQDGDSTSFRLVLRQTWKTIKKLVHPQGLLMTHLFDLAVAPRPVGFTTLLTKKVAVPPFVSEELSKSGTGQPALRRLHTCSLLRQPPVDLYSAAAGYHVGRCVGGLRDQLATDKRWRPLKIIGLLIIVAIPAGLAEHCWRC